MYKESLFNLYIEKENKTYIYNTLSGAMVAFKDKVDFQNVSCENEETLLKQGFIVDESLDELNMLKCQRNWTIWNPHPKGIVLKNIIWILVFGWELAISSCVFGLAWCITIVGIPFGLQFFKFAKIALLPFESHIYSS